jgi:cytoskeletal protein CcmA (bactofilin family)
VSYFQPKPGTGKSPGTPGTVTATSDVSPSTAAPAAAQHSTDVVSTFGTGTLITGNIVCDGSAQIFGRVIGDIQAAQIIIGDGARVEGNITAHDVAINGAFKGTVRSHSVKLKGAAVVDGEVFSKSLTVEENVQFEGLSRRLEKPIELTSSAQAASGTHSASAAQPAPSVQASPSMPAMPSAQPNGGRPFSATATAASAFSPMPANPPGSYSPTGA